MLKGFHICTNSKFQGDWSINGNNCVINLFYLKPFLLEERLTIIKHSEIAYKGISNQKRYEKCDISFPGIVCECENPLNLKYRLIDGNHRMVKMKNNNIYESLFYVIKREEFLDSLLHNHPIIENQN